MFDATGQLPLNHANSRMNGADEVDELFWPIEPNWSQLLAAASSERKLCG